MDRPTPSPELRQWVATWREAGKALAEVKRQELGRLVTAVALSQLADAFESALKMAPRTTSSGLIEQQRLFHRLGG